MKPNREKSAYFDQVFNIDEAWLNFESQEVGRREKRWIESPQEVKKPFKKYHPYLIKFPKNAMASEIWSEVLASYIGGDLLGLNIQKVFVAKDISESASKFGVLMESFLSHAYYGSVLIDGYSASETLVSGGEVLRRKEPAYELQEGKQHSLSLIREATNIEDKASATFNVSRTHFVKFWAETLAFDTLINNGDRHHDNWGMQPHRWQNRDEIQLRDELGKFIGGKDRYKFSTLYDHGGCLGSEMDPIGLNKRFNANNQSIPEMVSKYAQKGKPHMGFEKAMFGQKSMKSETFLSLLEKFLIQYPAGRNYVDRIASVDIASVEYVIEKLESLDIGVTDTHLRSPFVLELLKYRQSQLKSLFL